MRKAILPAVLGSGLLAAAGTAALAGNGTPHQPELEERADPRGLRRRAVRHHADRHSPELGDARVHRLDQRRPGRRPRAARRRHPLRQAVLHAGLRPARSSTCGPRFKDPLVYTPGDNEWTDCHKAAEGGGAYNTTTGQIDYVLDAHGNPVDYAGGDPLANLDLIRSIFFPHARRDARAAQEAGALAGAGFDPAHPTDAQYVENVMWEQSQRSCS